MGQSPVNVGDLAKSTTRIRRCEYIRNISTRGRVWMEKKRSGGRPHSSKGGPPGKAKKLRLGDTKHLFERSMLEILESRGCEKTC